MSSHRINQELTDTLQSLQNDTCQIIWTCEERMSIAEMHQVLKLHPSSERHDLHIDVQAYVYAMDQSTPYF